MDEPEPVCGTPDCAKNWVTKGYCLPCSLERDRRLDELLKKVQWMDENGKVESVGWPPVPVL